MLTPEEMAAVDAAAADRMDELMQRAGAAVARRALGMLGGAYGRRVHVVAGPGNNGGDGWVAADLLRRRGVRVSVGEHDGPVPINVDLDLVIDAAFGTGLSRSYEPPPLPSGVPVLAVDIPSGLDGLTGELRGRPWKAAATITFAALKSGLILGEGPEYCGSVQVADIGLSVAAEVGSGEQLTRWLVTDDDVAQSWPRRSVDSHKWQSAVWVIGGSPGMTGAAALVAQAATRAGAGYVLVSAPPHDQSDGSGVQDHLPAAPLPVEAVTRRLSGGAADPTAWHQSVAAEGRVGALVIGNGLGRDQRVIDGVIELLMHSEAPAVVDADALGGGGQRLLDACARRDAPTVLTPHDGEYAALMGESPGDDRLEAARRLARRGGCIALLKGPTTVIAGPDGRVAMSTSGDQRLATAGTGDVLAGVVGAALARDGDGPPMSTALMSAALAAHVHGSAALRGPAIGFRASDLPDLVAATLGEFLSARTGS